MTSMIRVGLLCAVACAFLGCTQPDGGSSGVPEAAAEPNVAPAAAEPAEAAAANEPAAPAEPAGEPELAQQDGRYFGLRFEMMPEEMQARFIELSSAELCPCEGQIASLDDCLKTEATSCELAIQSAALMMELIAINAESVQITDAVQGYVRNARAVHEFELDGVPYQGADDPDLVIVEFYDFECPHCKHLSEAWPQILDEFGDRIRVYHKQFPLQSHPNAAAASAAALAAHRQGMYFEFHERVFANQSRLQQASNPRPLFDAWAEEIGLNMERFAADIDDPAIAAMVARDRQDGVDAGIMGTPALYFNGVMLMGGFDVPTLQQTIRDRLGAAE